MPKRAKELSALDIKRAGHPGQPDRNIWIAAGGVSGLLLQITPNNAKSWLLRTTVGSARRGIGLGPYPEVGLAEARDRARAAKAKIVDGVDPVEERRAARATLAADERRGLLFAKAVDKWVEAKLDPVAPDKEIKAVRSLFSRFVLPEIGNLRVAEIDARDVLRVLSPVWTEVPEQARKVRMRIEQIFAWAAVAGHRPYDAPNPARWKANLDHLLPRLEQVRTRDHQPGVALGDVVSWWTELRERNGMASLAMQFATLTACRSGEVRGARWDELDLDAGIWTVPASRMKMKREHRVALSKAALDLIEAVPRMKDNQLAFPAERGGTLSDMALSQLMRRMQADAEKAAVEAGLEADKAGWRDPQSGRPAVPHGLRSTFRNWTAERGYDRDMAELALAHDVAEAVERAYRRSDMIERRRAMMEAWADFLDGKQGQAVVQFPAGARA